MQQNRQKVRIVKRVERERAESLAAEVATTTVVVEAAPAVNPERVMRTVVSGWVSEHRRRTDEFRHEFSVMMRNAGFLPPRNISRA